MKKLLLLVVCVFSATILFAQIECSTIAAIRSQADGASVKYIGSAVTTFYGPGGVLIQDETGYIYVKNAMLAESGTSSVRTNMQITSISGTFKMSTNEEMTLIEVTNRSINSIVVENNSASFDITDVDVNDFLLNPAKYECQPIRLSNVNVKSTGWAYYISSDKTDIALVAGWGVTIPTRGTFEGYYGNNGTKGFIIPSADHVYALAFATIANIKEAYEVEAPNVLEIIDPMLVNYVRINADNTMDVYAQQTDQYATVVGVVLHLDSYAGVINAGDSIKGVKGMYKAFALNDNGTIKYGSVFNITAEDAQSIVVLNSNNAIETTIIDDIEYVIDGGARNYEAILAVTPKGKIVSIDGNYYLQSNTKSIRLAGVDFAKYVDQSVAIVGVVDAGVLNQGETTLIVRFEKDILATSYTFASIAKMKEQGEPLATGITYALSGNVVVTHIHSWKVEELTIYGLFVQDATAGLYIESQSKPNVAVGDSINGIVGSYHGYIVQKSGAKFNILSSGNLDKVEYDEVTMSMLAANPEMYASRVVKLMGVGHGSREVANYGETYIEKYLHQDGDTMVYDIWNYTLYDNSNIIGVFDYGSYQSFSIVPLSQKHIEDATLVGLDDVLTDEILYSRDGNILASGATSIAVYNLNGQVLRFENADYLNIADLQLGIYIVVAQFEDGIHTVKIVK